MLVLYNLVVMERHSNDKGANKGSEGGDGMSPGYPLAWNLSSGQLCLNSEKRCAYNGDDIAVAMFGRHY